MKQDDSSTGQPLLNVVAKKAYVKPDFEWERVFETMALSCGKLNATQATCRGNRKNS